MLAEALPGCFGPRRMCGNYVCPTESHRYTVVALGVAGRASTRCRKSQADWMMIASGEERHVGFIRGFDEDTLREVVDTAECDARLAEIDGQRSLPALLERVWLLKVLGRLDEALSLGDETVRFARMAGTRQDLLRSRVLRATVLQYRGAYAAADQEMYTCAAEAEGQGWPSIAAFAHQHRGRNAYEAGDFAQARESFKRTLFLRREAGADDAALESALRAIEAADKRRGPALVLS